jgi:predicted kinase
VLVGGEPGTGKSTVAQELAARFGWVVLRSDEVRKDITGVGRSTRSPSDVGAGIYTPAVTDLVYRALLRRAELGLRSGESVILDATWSSASWRSAARRVATDASADLVELRCDLPPDVAASRIERRLHDGTDVSDADARIAAAVRAQFDDWPEAHTVSTVPPVDVVVDAAAALVGAHR